MSDDNKKHPSYRRPVSIDDLIKKRADEKARLHELETDIQKKLGDELHKKDSLIAADHIGVSLIREALLAQPETYEYYSPRTKESYTEVEDDPKYGGGYRLHIFVQPTCSSAELEFMQAANKGGDKTHWLHNMGSEKSDGIKDYNTSESHEIIHTYWAKNPADIITALNKHLSDENKIVADRYKDLIPAGLKK